MKIYLLDINLETTQAWNRYFSDEENVEVVQDIFDRFMENHTVECVVSPGNSYGVMKGGYDLAISKYFGWELTERVQHYIKNHFDVCQPVGTSIIFDTYCDINAAYKNDMEQNYNHIQLIHTPSMEVPSVIDDPRVVYDCMHSTLLLAAKKEINSIVIPAFGGGCGQVPSEVIAREMWNAYEDVKK